MTLTEALELADKYHNPETTDYDPDPGNDTLVIQVLAQAVRDFQKLPAMQLIQSVHQFGGFEQAQPVRGFFLPGYGPKE